MLRSKLANLTSLLVAFVVLSGSTVFAATAATPNASNGSASDNGLKVSPVRSDVTINAGTTQAVQVTVTNVTSSVSSYDILVNDFTASSDESGQPQILLDATKYAPSHSLKRLVGTIPGVTLQPGESKNVRVPIVVPKSYAAGGYYGAIRFAPHTSDNADAKNVTLSASVGSLVLVTVPGNINEQLTVASLDVREAVDANQVDTPRTVFFDGKDINGVVRFQNSGDVQEQPFGKITLKNWRGKVLGTYEVNNTTPRGNVLPESIRKFSLPLKDVGGFGKYTMVGNFGYGNKGQLITASTTFYVIPVLTIVLALGLIALVLYLIFGLPRTIKWYNRRVVSRANSRNR
ncbi:MAG: hypothetical protein JWN82_163 [Candidatus Saccharibacteria bacterium]|nr:hypothetical protein [Candidatus Saccharibacteria bacterium]